MPTNINGLYIKGGPTPITVAGDYISFLTLPKDAYLSSTSFTITFWIYAAQTTAVTALKTARVIDFSDAITKVNGLAVYLKPGTNALNAAVVLEAKAGSSTAQTVSDSGAGFAPKTWTHVAITVTTSGSTITTAIYYNGVVQTTTGTITALPATSTIFTTNFIGKGTSPVGGTDENLDAYLNDVKMFNSALSATLVASQYTSEKCNFYF